MYKKCSSLSPPPLPLPPIKLGNWNAAGLRQAWARRWDVVRSPGGVLSHLLSATHPHGGIPPGGFQA